MSKIQDALKKIQGTASSSGGEKEDAGAGNSDNVMSFPDDLEAFVSGEESNDRKVQFRLDAFQESGHLANHPTARGSLDREFQPAVAAIANRVSVSETEGAFVVFVSSQGEQAGRTFIALNLAISFAHSSEMSVLLVDADSAHPEISALLDIQDRPGFQNLQDETTEDEDADELQIETSMNGLSVMPIGVASDESDEDGDESNLQTVINKLREKSSADVVIVDCPQLSSYEVASGTEVQSAMALMVVCAGVDRRQDITAASSRVATLTTEYILNQA